MWFRRAVLAAAMLMPTAFARAELPATVKVGILNDMNGPFADQSGRGSVVAAQMAAEEFAAQGAGFKVEILSADHLNKPDVGVQIVREWVDRDGVDAVADAVNSGVGLAVNTVMAEKHRTFIATNVGTSDLTGKFCQPTTVQWTMDTYAMGNTMARAMMKQGADTWYYISFDYALGAALERDSSAVLTSLGGKVVGSVKHPLGTSDFSSYLLRARSSGANVIALAATGADLINAVKQAAEFGITRGGTKLASLGANINDIYGIGLDATQGMVLSDAFYWDTDDETRAFSKRFYDKLKKMPNMLQAGVYSATTHYLQAVQAAGTTDSGPVMEKMRNTPIHDFFAHDGHIRVDGLMVHDMYLFQVKTPTESKGPWDLYKRLATIPGDQAFQPLSESRCPLVKK